MINNLTNQPPRSPKDKYENLVALPRMFDKLRARANNSLGEYKTGEASELDRQLCDFIGSDLRKNFENVFSTVTPESTDEEIYNLILNYIENSGGTMPADEDKGKWSENMLNMKFIDDPDRTAYASMLIEKMNLDPNITSFDFLLIGE